MILDRLQTRLLVSPDAVCYTYLEDVTDARDLTYQELDNRARAVAHGLLQHAVKGDRVLLLMPSGIEFLAAFWGCLYAGMIAVPLYAPKANDRSGRVHNIVGDCSPQLAIVLAAPEHEQITALPTGTVKCVLFADLALPHAPQELPTVRSDDIAFLQYSSGSTGDPKGVMISHKGLMANLLVLESETDSSAADIFVGWLPLFHDMGLVMMVLMPIFVGARSVLFSPARFARSPLFWLQVMSRYKGTISGAPNFAYETCARKYAADALEAVDLSRWRMALNGAEPVRAATIAEFSRVYAAHGFNEASMTPAYGMAEATVFLCAGKLTTPPHVVELSAALLQQGWAAAPMSAQEKSLSVVGCGLSPTAHEFVIVRDAGVLAENQVGEVWTKGDSISSGYWNKPGLSEHVFKAYTTLGRGPYLRTGDLGFIRAGELFVLGRSGDVLIIQGENFYPHDLEGCALKTLPVDAVGDAVVFASETGDGSAVVLVLEVRPRLLPRTYDDSAADIRVALFASFGVLLSEIVFAKVGTIDKTTSGKVMRSTVKDRHAHGGLKALMTSTLDLNGTGPRQAPAGATGGVTEIALAAIWAALLLRDASSIGGDDNFFALGGNSLLAVRLIAQVRQTFGVELALRELFASTTLTALAAAIDQGAGLPTRPRVIAQARGAAVLPLSFAQQRLWFLDRLDAGSAHYNMPAALRVRGRFDVAAAEAAFARIIARHEPLRTVFLDEGGQLYQVIREQVDFGIAVTDLRHLAEAGREQAAQAAMAADARAPFDLSRDVMLRASFLALGEDNGQELGLLLFNMHHIASDGWSMDLLIGEFMAQYAALRMGAADPCAPLALRYADYAQWQRDWLAGPLLAEQFGYWQQQLADLPPVHSLPLDRPRPAYQRFDGARHRFRVAPQVQARLLEIAQAGQATLFMVLHAALSVLLARHGNTNDIVIGTPVANRLQKELEEIIGFFVNTLVLRTDVSGNPSFEQLLARVKVVNLEAQSRQDVPFEYLVEQLNPLRSTQYSSLFQVMLSMDMDEGRRVAAMECGDTRFSLVPRSDVAAKYELTINADSGADGLALSIDYNVGLFDAQTIERLAGHYQRLLEGIAAAPQTPLFALPMLSEAERLYLLYELNATAAVYPKQRSIDELFEEQAERRPDRVALVFEDHALTYRELGERARQLARRLRGHGVAPGTLVGLYAERGIDMVVGLLGILKAGGAYVPLDPAYPRERLAYMLEDARPPVVLTQRRLREQLPAGAAMVLCLDSGGDGAEVSSGGANLAMATECGHLAYVIYTSGSTGQPKGVRVSRRNLTNFIIAMRATPGMRENDVLLSVTSLSFDIAALEIFLPLTVGAKIIMVSSEAAANPALLALAAERHSVSFMQATPSTWRMLVDADCFPFTPGLKILCGGEALPWALAQQLLARTPQVWNMYGPTETTIWSTACLLREADRVVPIGRPITNTRLYIVDEHLNPVPSGVCGELYIAGDGVADGYLHQPELTRSRFVSDPFDASGGRMYKTGDLVRYRNDGNIEYVGRMDQQVKIRGFRIELGEIENRLTRHADIDGAVVLAKPDDRGDPQLVAYITVKAGRKAPAVAVLKVWIGEALPAFMVPPRVAVIDAWPLTANGKIDRKALPAPDVQPSQDEYVAPRNDIEAELVCLWANLLQLDEHRISVNASFFMLGGHSLMLVRLLSHIAQRFQVRLDIRDVFAIATVAQLAAFIDDVVRVRSPGLPQAVAAGRHMVEFEI